jgi:succinate dehydrogenase hydrophobic anchor subunit
MTTPVAGIRPRAVVGIVAIIALPIVIFLVSLLIGRGAASPASDLPVWPNYLVGGILTLTVIVELLGITLRSRQILKSVSDLEMVRREIKHSAFMATVFVVTSFCLGISVGRLLVR